MQKFETQAVRNGVWQHDILCIRPSIAFFQACFTVLVKLFPKGSKMPASYFHIEYSAVGITEDDLEEINDPYYELEIAPKLTTIVAERKLPIKKGDIVGLFPLDDHYRNEGCFIFDGEQVIPLDSSIDEYGAVPSSFKVSDTEFSIHHWESVITHNNIFHLAQPIINRMYVYWNDSRKLYIANMRIGKTLYACIIVPSEEEIDALLNGEEVKPALTKEQVLTDLKDGKYYFDLHHGDLDCIDWDYQPAKMFYAIRSPEEDE